MTLQETLDQLSERRLAFKAYQQQVEEELRALRLEKLGAEKASIEYLVAKAAAEGATTGQIKRAYGTKDHRTIADILGARAKEIEAIRTAAEEAKRGPEWFQLDSEFVRVFLGEHSAMFQWHDVEGELMFTTEEPLWNEDFTIKNEAVALLDGKLESESEAAAEVASAIRG